MTKEVKDVILHFSIAIVILSVFLACCSNLHLFMAHASVVPDPAQFTASAMRSNTQSTVHFIRKHFTIFIAAYF